MLSPVLFKTISELSRGHLASVHFGTAQIIMYKLAIVCYPYSLYPNIHVRYTVKNFANLYLNPGPERVSVCTVFQRWHEVNLNVEFIAPCNTSQDTEINSVM